jgi:amidase
MAVRAVNRAARINGRREPSRSGTRADPHSAPSSAHAPETLRPNRRRGSGENTPEQASWAGEAGAESAAMTDETVWSDATAQAELVRRGEVSAAALVDDAIARIERLNPVLNAVIHPLFDKARAAVDAGLPAGPFRGVPIVLKDFGGQSAGDPYHEGTTFLRDAGWRASEDDHIVTLLRQAGFVIVGRTNVPELASAPTTEPDAYGPTRNPWDTELSAGGSSGGSAAAVAAGMVPVAHGSDGGGSLRIPASECGLVGLKPSRGRISFGPSVGEGMAGLAVGFVLTRSVRDAAALLAVLARPAVGDPYTAPSLSEPHPQSGVHRPLRIGLRTEAPAMSGGADVAVHHECVAAAAAAARLLEGLGHTVERACPAVLDEDDIALSIGTVVFATVARALDYWSERLGRPLRPDDVNPDTWVMAELARATTAPAYIAALDRLHVARVEMSRWWANGCDLLLTPTLAEPPPRLGELRPDASNPLAASVRAVPLGTFTIPFNVTGQPAISLPLHWTPAGLPIGIQLVAAYGREDTLLSVATQLENAQPWATRRPRAALGQHGRG